MRSFPCVGSELKACLSYLNRKKWAISEFEIQDTIDGFTLKLWRGEPMCLLGFDIAAPEEDLVGFAVEFKEPGASDFQPLRNRLAFSYNVPPDVAVTGDRQFSSLEAPFQKFRWIHFPKVVKNGVYTYRATKMHMPQDLVLKKGQSVTLQISLDPVTYSGFLDIGFTRNFASSQAFREKLGNPPDINAIGATIIPANADDGLKFRKMAGDIYQWMGFEAYDLFFGFLNDVINDPGVTLDVLAYDFNEPDILKKLEALGHRLRVIIDDSTTVTKGVETGHGVSTSAESTAAKRLQKLAGKKNVKRTHFKNLQHHKVLIARRGGKPFKVLGGSTNFSYRGFYIQANNALVFDNEDVAGLYGAVFDAAFDDPNTFENTELARNGIWYRPKTCRRSIFVFHHTS